MSIDRYKYSFVPLSIKQLNTCRNVYAMYIMHINLFYCVFIILIINLFHFYLPLS